MLRVMISVLVLACGSEKSSKPPPQAPPPAAGSDAAPTPVDAGLAIEITGNGASTVVGPCKLAFMRTPGQLQFSASAEAPPATCDALDPAFVDAWQSLAKAVPVQGAAQTIGLQITFDADIVDAWFRSQAASAELQGLLKAKRSGESGLVKLYQELAEHLVSSGSLARYTPLLDRLGYAIDGAQVEKVEIRTVKAWRDVRPDVKALNDLDAGASLALPNAGSLMLRAK